MTTLRYKGYHVGYRPLPANKLLKVQEYEILTGKEIDEIYERSAGCVVFSHDPITKEIMVLLIENFGKWYSFPKGHVDEGEDDITAAIRETVEEAGVVLSPDQLDPKGLEVKYTLANKLHNDRWKKHPLYPDESQRPLVIGYKTVIHFSAYTTNQQCSPQLEEVAGVKFYKIEEAMSLLQSSIRQQLQDHLMTEFVQQQHSLASSQRQEQ